MEDEVIASNTKKSFRAAIYITNHLNETSAYTKECGLVSSEFTLFSDRGLLKIKIDESHLI